MTIPGNYGIYTIPTQFKKDNNQEETVFLCILYMPFAVKNDQQHNS